MGSSALIVTGSSETSSTSGPKRPFISPSNAALMQRAALVAFGIIALSNLPQAEAGPANYGHCSQVYYGSYPFINDGFCPALVQCCLAALFGPDFPLGKS